MITNIIAAVTITVVTNVSMDVDREVIGHNSLPSPTDGNVTLAVYCFEPVYGKELAKKETTTVTEITTLRFKWAGSERVITSQRVLSEKVKWYKKTEGWEAVPKKPDSPATDTRPWTPWFCPFPGTTTMVTNMVVTNLMYIR